MSWQAFEEEEWNKNLVNIVLHPNVIKKKLILTKDDFTW